MTHITLFNGETRLAASVHGRMDAAPILLLHGITMSRDTWDEITLRLLDRYCVWTIDFRGHGHSDAPSISDLLGYVSDAETALAVIGRPTIIIGHSLGACVAGVLGQKQPECTRGLSRGDRLGSWATPNEWKKSVFPNLFSILSSRLTKWQDEPPLFGSYLYFLSNGPDLLGGPAKDHISARHLLSHASALQRVDPSCLSHEALKETLQAISTERAFRCPSKGRPW